MTIKLLHKRDLTSALGILFLIYVSCFLITFSVKFKLHNESLSYGILADLLITAPLIYFFTIRKSNVSKSSITKVIILGILLAFFLLDFHSNPLLIILKTWALPILEILSILTLCRKLYTINKKARASTTAKLDFLFHYRNIALEVFKNEKMGNIIATEMAVIYYTFFSTKDKSVDYKTKYSSYKENGLSVLLSAILFILIIETTILHFLLSLWNTKLAFILTGLSLYTCIQMFAHIRAVKARPIILNTKSIEIHHGLAGDASINFEDIEKIELSDKEPIDKASVKITLLKRIESHNIVIYLKKPVEITGVFGIRKKSDTLLFFVDQPKEFVKSVRKCLITNIT